MGMPGERERAPRPMTPDRRAFGGAKVARISGKFKGSEGDSHALEQGSGDENDPLPQETSDEAGEGASGPLGPGGTLRNYSWSCRFSDSTSSDSAVSLATSASILRTACSTVV